MSTKTPGQIAYEAHEASYRKISTPWEKLDKWQRHPWDVVAAAVLATVPQTAVGRNGGSVTMVASPHGGTAYGWAGGPDAPAPSGGSGGGGVVQQFDLQGVDALRIDIGQGYASVTPVNEG